MFVAVFGIHSANGIKYDFANGKSGSLRTYIRDLPAKISYRITKCEIRLLNTRYYKYPMKETSYDVRHGNPIGAHNQLH